MQVIDTAIPAVKRVIPKRHGDDRGWFSETFRADLLAKAGIDTVFVQDNQSFSKPAGTLRGLHFQLAPAAQTKLVRVLSGAILDVAVDLRRASPTYGRHVAVRLDAEGERATLRARRLRARLLHVEEPDTMVAYKVDAYYSPAHDRSVIWNDTEIGIDWPVSADAAILSDKDKRAPPPRRCRRRLLKGRMESHPMRILVTGGCGFIGSALVLHLVRDLGHEVLTFDALTYAANPISLQPLDAEPRHQLRAGRHLRRGGRGRRFRGRSGRRR